MPIHLTTVKVIQESLLVHAVFAIDKAGNVWKRTEGFGNERWELVKKVAGSVS
jgi:hypothetical protein